MKIALLPKELVRWLLPTINNKLQNHWAIEFLNNFFPLSHRDSSVELTLWEAATATDGSGARSGGSLSVRPAPPHLRCADDRSDCRSDRSSLSDGPQHPPELATAGTVTGKRHATAPPIGAECVACVVGVLGVLFSKIPTPAQTTYSKMAKAVLVPSRV